MKKNAITIHTLGPSGTNCELAANYWIKSNSLNGNVKLYETLEKALVAMQKDCKSYLLSCAVYPYLHEIVFSNLNNMRISDSFVFNTYRMVLASKSIKSPKTIATHPAPQVLCEGNDNAILHIVSSNSQAAKDCRNGKVDACITTIKSCEDYDLLLLKDFGEVPMVFILHENKYGEF